MRRTDGKGSCATGRRRRAAINCESRRRRACSASAPRWQPCLTIAGLFEQAFKNIDDILHKDAGCTSELDYTEQSSWLLFLKDLDALEAGIDTATYDLSVKNPNGGDDVAMRKPQDILDDIAALDAESAEVLATIRSLVA